MNTIHLEKSEVLKKSAVNKSSSRFLIQVLILLVFIMMLMNVFLALFANNIWAKYHEDDRITYVTLDPVGNWTIERTERQKDDFYQATVNSVISRMVGMCYSMNPATIYNDWAICSAFLSKNALDGFLYENHYIKNGQKFNDFVDEKIACGNCKSVRFEVRDIDHKNNIPTSFKDVYGRDVQIYESLIYGNFIDSDGKNVSAVIDLKWSFFSKDKTSTLGSLLIENPLGIYFINSSVVEDISK